MKRVLTLISLLLPLMAWAQQRTLTEINEIAVSSLNCNATTSKKVLANATLTTIPASKIINIEGLHLQNEPFYLCEQNGKTVFISGDKRMPEVLGYTEHGGLGQEIPENVKYWMKCCAESYESLQNAPANATVTADVQKLPVIEGGVASMVTTRWNQDKPYNNKCPKVNNQRCYTGCVATQMAQILNYHQYPSSGYGKVNYTSYSNKLELEYDFSSTTFDWNHMLDRYDGDYSTEEANAVAELMLACGCAAEMDYGTNGSGAYAFSGASGLYKYLGYDKCIKFAYRYFFTDEEWESLMITELNEGRPIPYGGNVHAYLIDGYKAEMGTVKYNVNWGWGGFYDGDYAITGVGALHPGGTGIGGGAAGSSYTEGQYAYLGVQPASDTHDVTNALLCSDITYLSTDYFPSGSNASFDIIIEDIIQCGVSRFRGSVGYEVVDSINQIVAKGTQDISHLSYLEEDYNIEIPVTIKNLEDGLYTVHLYSLDDDGYTSPIYIHAAKLTFVMGDHASLHLASNANLQVTGLNVDQSEGRHIEMSVTRLTNLSQTTFSGKIALAVLEENGNFIQTISDEMFVDGLANKKSYSSELQLSGELPETLDEEQVYRLGLVAQEDKHEGWNIVRQYTYISGPTGIIIRSRDEDCTIPYSISKGILVGITTATYSTSDKVYDLSGRRTVNRRGITITNGKKLLK